MGGLFNRTKMKNAVLKVGLHSLFRDPQFGTKLKVTTFRLKLIANLPYI